MHKAIIDDEDPQEILSLIAEYEGTLHRRDCEGRSAMAIALQLDHERAENIDEDVMAALLSRFLPFDPETQERVSPDVHEYAWSTVVQTDRYEHIVATILAEFPGLAYLLSAAEDVERRHVIDIASPQCKKRINENLWVFKRYELLTALRPHHQSDTCTVHIAIDHNDYSRRVALKFMRYAEEFRREFDVRARGAFDEKYVVDIIRVHDPDEDEAYYVEAFRKGFEDSPYLVVMEAGERSLNDIITKEHIAGKDWDLIRTLCRQVLRTTVVGLSDQYTVSA